MNIASDKKSQRDDKGIRDDMRISVPNKSRETVPKTYSISDNVTSTDVRKTLTLSPEVPETPAIMSNISVDIAAEQTVKSYSDTVRNDNKFQQVKKKSCVVYGKSTKNTLRAAPDVQFDACISGVDSVYKEEDLANFLNEHKIVYASLKCYSKSDSVSKTFKVAVIIDILFLQEHWMLHNNLHKLQAINEDFHVFSMSGIKEQEHLMDRRMEGVPFLSIKQDIIVYLLIQKILVYALFFQNMIQLLLFLFVYICHTISIVIYMSTMRFSVQFICSNIYIIPIL